MRTASSFECGLGIDNFLLSALFSSLEALFYLFSLAFDRVSLLVHNVSVHGVASLDTTEVEIQNPRRVANLRGTLQFFRHDHVHNVMYRLFFFTKLQ